MSDPLKIILCGIQPFDSNFSWSGTHVLLESALAERAEIIGEINYNIENKYINWLHKYYTVLRYGSKPFVRDEFICYFREKKFMRLINKINIKPDVFFQVSSLVVPGRLVNEGTHAIYTDATITAPIKYGLLNFPDGLIKSVNRQFEKYSPRIDVFFTMNEWTRNSLINDFNIAPEKVHNVSFGINVEPFNGEREYSNKLMLTVIRRGNEEQKGTFLLLDAFNLARESLPDLKLAVVGSTLDRIEGVTYYEGYPRSKTKELFREASVYIMPALMEVNGITYLEALASKTPIIGLNRCAFPEFSGYGKYGFIAEEATPESVAEQILNAFSDEDRLKTMGELGQQFVLTKFTWDRTADNIINILNSIK